MGGARADPQGVRTYMDGYGNGFPGPNKRRKLERPPRAVNVERGGGLAARMIP